MKIENQAAYKFILTDDLFLLDTDKAFFASAPKEITEQETPGPVFNYMGGNKKNYLVITFYADEEHIALPHQTALESTLKRIGYDMNDIAILNMYKHKGVSFDEMGQFFSPQKVLILGDDAQPAGLKNGVLNKLVKMDEINMLLTYSFTEMMTDNNKKKVFWEQVKQL